MDKSFTIWRGAVDDDSQTENESDDDIVEDSTKDSSLMVPDSDDYESFSKIQDSRKSKSSLAQSVVESSDEDYINTSNPSSTSIRSSGYRKKLSIDSSISITNENDTPPRKLNVSSPVHPSRTQKINKQKIVIDSESDSDEEDKVKSMPFQITQTDSEEENTKDANSIQLDHKPELSVTKSFKSDSICSSTRFLDHTNQNESNHDKKCDPKLENMVYQSDSSSKKEVPIIDLTVLKERIEKKHAKHQESPKNDSKNVIVIDSNSDNEATEGINRNLSSLEISSNINTKENIKQQEISKFFPVKRNENDYFSRVESLNAEEGKLKTQVSKLLQDIEVTKATLRNANISALPDKGVRLQMFLKKQESQLRDLRYQQSTLSNELLKLQTTSSGMSHPTKEINKKQEIKQKIFNLPTTSTDINAMGKRAMETHRTEQALTVDTLRLLHNSLKNRPSEDFSAEDPKGLCVQLMPHQKQALAWLMWREKEKPSGGILADDMGLGKTLTLISLIMKCNEENDNDDDKDDSDNSDQQSDSESNSGWMSSARRQKLVKGKTLVVCPATLLGQWEGEIKNKVRRGVLTAHVHHGQQRERKARRLARPDVVITTYNIVSRDGNVNKESPLFQIRWERIILDEAHQIRNYKTQTAKSVFLLKARSRWALTGTPVHNKEIDLFALLKFLRCSPFDDLAVWKRWVDNRDAAGMQRLNTITQSLMLRRTKQGLQEKGELKSLSTKKFHTIFVTLDHEEQEAYEKLLNFSKTLFAQFLAQKAEKEDVLDGIAVTSKASQYLKNTENPFENHPNLARLHKQMVEITDVKGHHILLLILRLRQFCCHPALIKSMLDKEDMSSNGIEVDGYDVDMMDKLTRMSLAPTQPETLDVDSEVSILSTENPLYAEDRLNSKLRKVVETVESIMQTEDKLIIVSQWLSLLDVMERVMKEKKIQYVKLTGNVPIKDRTSLVDRFNRKGHDPRVMLLSLTAGGVGLNLVGGNHLLLLDLHWNPQLESQACDRIYRVGQEKNVQIYKFVTSETIEESILRLQEKKLKIADNIVNQKQGANSSKLSLDDLKMLFKIS